MQGGAGFLPSTVSPGGSQLAAVNSSGPSCTAKPCTAGVGPLSRCTWPKEETNGNGV